MNKEFLTEGPRLPHPSSKSPFRSILHGVRRRWQSLAHPLRRRAAIRRLRNLGEVQRIVLLCTGNVCRSPYAEGILRLRQVRGGTLDLVSAGLMGSGRTPPPEANLSAGDRGVDLQGHRSRLFSLRLASWADLVVVMEPAHQRVLTRDYSFPKRRTLLLSDLDPQVPDRRWIFDPLGHALEVFEESYDQVDRCIDELLEIIQT